MNKRDDLPYWFGFFRGTIRRYCGGDSAMFTDEAISRWIHTYDNDIDAKYLAVQGYQAGLYGSVNDAKGMPPDRLENSEIDMAVVGILNKVKESMK